MRENSENVYAPRREATRQIESRNNRVVNASHDCGTCFSFFFCFVLYLTSFSCFSFFLDIVSTVFQLAWPRPFRVSPIGDNAISPLSSLIIVGSFFVAFFFSLWLD